MRHSKSRLVEDADKSASVRLEKRNYRFPFLFDSLTTINQIAAATIIISTSALIITSESIVYTSVFIVRGSNT